MGPNQEERRDKTERRTGGDRRVQSLSYNGVERRKTQGRRAQTDRRECA